jgi:hypothetical protein
MFCGDGCRTSPQKICRNGQTCELLDSASPLTDLRETVCPVTARALPETDVPTGLESPGAEARDIAAGRTGLIETIGIEG